MVIVLHALNHLIGGGLPVLYPVIMEEFRLSYVQLGLLRSASSFSAGLPQMFVGILRRWLPGRVLIGLGNIVNSALNIAAGFTTGFGQFLALRVLGGIGISPQHPVGSSILTTNTDPSHRGKVFGLNLAFLTLASTISPLVAAVLLDYIGWRSSLSLLGWLPSQ